MPTPRQPEASVRDLETIQRTYLEAQHYRGEVANGLSGIRAKMARSLELLIDLDSLMHEYLDSDPVDLQRQIQPDGLTSVFALLVTTEPPLDLALRVGEVVHQIRSALDHLANRLVRAAGHQPTRRTSFPIIIRPPRKAVAIHPGLDPKALSVIDQVQPYHRGHEPDHHPLAVLNELWNIDKHRNLSLTATLLANSQIYISDAKGGWRVGGQFQPGPLADDGIVGVFRFEGGGPSADAEVEASGDLFVTIADTGPWGTARPVTEILEELHQYVSVTVVPRLEPFC